MIQAFALSVMSLAAQDPGPARVQPPRDATGIDWVLPFAAARQEAAARQRLLFIKSIAFATTPHGNWGPESEVLRAGPFSDERVIALLNRRFVPFYFDLSDTAAAGDPEARKFVAAKRKELRGPAVQSPTALLLMTAEGEVAGEIRQQDTPEDIINVLLSKLDNYPEYAAPGPEEQGATGVALARIRLDLRDVEGARAALEGVETDEARYLRGRMFRFEAKWDAMEREFTAIEDESYADHLRMERAYRHWHDAAYEALREALAGFPDDSERFTEARYYEGLAHFHLGSADQARATWQSTITSRPQDRWIYRADWAFAHSKKDIPKGPFQTVMVSSAATAATRTPLGRSDYYSFFHPDLNR